MMNVEGEEEEHKVKSECFEERRKENEVGDLKKSKLDSEYEDRANKKLKENKRGS
jgi:hypothetical protein